MGIGIKVIVLATKIIQVTTTAYQVKSFVSGASRGSTNHKHISKTNPSIVTEEWNKNKDHFLLAFLEFHLFAHFQLWFIEDGGALREV